MILESKTMFVAEASLDLEALLAELSSDAPCGEDLEYDGEFAEMERASHGTAEQQFGSTIIEGQEPEWQEVYRRALGLLQRTKDLRVATYLCQALLTTQGLAAFTEGLHLLSALLTRYWDTIHPLLDLADDNDPTIQVNALAALCDNETTLKSLRATPIVSSRLVGRFSLTDIQASQTDTATGAADAKNVQKAPDAAVIAAAFQDMEIGDLQHLRDMATEAVTHATEIENAITRQVGSGRAVSFGPLRQVLKDIQSVYSAQLDRRGNGGGDSQASDTGTGAESGELGLSGGHRTGALNLDGELQSREEVVRIIDKALAYYRRAEPSSPVPLLLHRAKRLVNLNFVEILKNLTPDSLIQLQVISGMSNLDNYGEASA